MTSVIAALFLIIFGLASPGIVGVSPEALHETGLMSKPPPPCRELTDGEKLERGIDPKGKAATYSLNGEYLCEHQIFDYGERDPYVDFVIRNAPARAQGVARQAALLARTEPQMLGKPWSVDVHAEPPALQTHLRRLYQQALAEAMGAGRVARGITDPKVLLSVTPRPVQDVDILFDVTATVPSEGGKVTWHL